MGTKKKTKRKVVKKQTISSPDAQMFGILLKAVNTKLNNLQNKYFELEKQLKTKKIGKK